MELKMYVGTDHCKAITIGSGANVIGELKLQWACVSSGAPVITGPGDTVQALPLIAPLVVQAALVSVLKLSLKTVTCP